MPATSQAQQKFMNLVQAVKKGEVPAAKVTSNVRQAAKDMSAADVDDFASTKLKGLPKKVTDIPSRKAPGAPDATDKKEEGFNFFDIVGKYNEYGKLLRRENTLSELGQQLSDIAEYAEHTLTNESPDWFDAHTIRRNIKEMQGYAKEFQKIAEEADSYNMRMEALYDDMGRVLERYFDIYDQEHNPSASQPAASPTAAQQQVVQPQMETPAVAIPETAPVAEPVSEAPMEVSAVQHSSPLTEKAITLARTRLRGENLAKFDTLPKERQARVAWRIIR